MWSFGRRRVKIDTNEPLSILEVHGGGRLYDYIRCAELDERMVEYYEDPKNGYTLHPIKNPYQRVKKQQDYFRARFELPKSFPDRNRFPPFHYAHVDPTDYTLIRFYDSERNFERDVYTRLKVGRYIARYLPELKDEVNALSAAWGAFFKPMELKFARTADEVEEVYSKTEGMGSCMGKPVEFFKKSVGIHMHPMRYIGDSDLSVGYIEREGRIVARTLVWEEKKLYNYRIYGDEVRLREAFRQAGFTTKTSWPFAGARIRYIPLGKGYLAGSVDGHSCGTIEGEFIRLDPKGKTPVTTTQGGFNVGRYCDVVKEYLPTSEFIVVNNEYWSKAKCRQNGFICDFNGTYHPLDQRVEMANGNLWSERSFKSYGMVCAGNGLNYPNSEMISIKGLQYSKQYMLKRIESKEIKDVAAA